MNAANSITVNSTLTTDTGQPTPVQRGEQNDSMTGFFAVGMVINIVIVVAFFIWAYRQWGKTSKRDG